MVGLDRKIFREVIPVDDEWHELKLTGPIVHVACRELTTVDVWFINGEHHYSKSTFLRVFGTGQPLPDNAEYVGTGFSPVGGLVWHVMRMGNRV